MTEGLDVLEAGNAGPFTLDGTRTFLVGREQAIVIDPGPDVEDHVRALAFRMESLGDVRIVLTHGHADHAGSAAALSAATGAPVWGPAGLEEYGVPTLDRILVDGDVVETDVGPLTAVHTPGHTPEHLCFHWPGRRALFVGDLLLGLGDTTWVAEYPGCVAEYLASLARLREFDLDVLYPAHGPPLTDPAEAVDRFERHRRGRIEQAARALERWPDADVEELVTHVYGDALPEGLRGAAVRSLGALVEHVRAGYAPS